MRIYIANMFLLERPNSTPAKQTKNVEGRYVKAVDRGGRQPVYFVLLNSGSVEVHHQGTDSAGGL
jgi:hypothetical protein